MADVAFVLLLALSLPVLLGAGYLLLFVVLSGAQRPKADSPRQHRFRVIVPAHDEEQGIADTVRSLRALSYPPEAFSVLVVADNCGDRTAEVARQAGAEVLERRDDKLRGKGYALLHAFERLPEDVDAVVVIDADTLVSPNLLTAFSARLALGARAIQADYAVRNPHQSWRTRLIAIAFGAFHIVRGRGREALRLSAGLRGNGMCFSTDILRTVPHDAFSIVEDVEYGIRLGEAGCRVNYADEAHVFGEMVTTATAARSQRQRWEGGRRALKEAHGWRLVGQGVKTRQRVLFDLGFDLLLPPLSRLAGAAAAGWALATLAALLWGGRLWLPVAAWSFAVGALVLYVLRGWAVSRTGLRGLLDLALAPAYVAWKVTLGRSAKVVSDAHWVRTAREAKGEDVAPN